MVFTRENNIISGKKTPKRIKIESPNVNAHALCSGDQHFKFNDNFK